MILIVAPDRDAHAVCVASELVKSARPFRFVDTSKMSTTGRAEFRAGHSDKNTWLSEGGGEIVLSEVKTVWYRRRYMPPPPAGVNDIDRGFIAQEWLHFFNGLLATMDAWFVNDPVCHDAAVKPRQLRIAQELGLRVPDTVITNNPVTAASFIEAHSGNVVHKTLSPPRHRWLGTTKWKTSDSDILDDLVLAPTIFQESITNCDELRVTVIGDDVFPVRFRPPDGMIDGRLAVDVSYTVHVLPDHVLSAILLLTRRLGLVYCTIDMKLTEDGEYIFLELNPQGQFLYIEMLAGAQISKALAALLLRGRSSLL